jgi:polygalacturonase
MSRRFSRREFIMTAAASACAWPALSEARQRRGTGDPWARADEIVGAIRVPRFPNRDFDITSFGAVGDGVASCTGPIRKAIAACRATGGGRVVVPKGRFLTGAIRIESGVDLHLAQGSTLAFSSDPREYLPVVFTRWEGVELMN